MPKRRLLSSGQEVIIIYDVQIGYVNHSAVFKKYTRIMYGDVYHNIPVFDYKNKEISGLDCFWVLPSDAPTKTDIEKFQYNLINAQSKIIEIGKQLNYKVPQKIKDSEIHKMAEDSINRMNQLIQKLGYDPRDNTWIEQDLAVTERERKWFVFERENGLIFSQNWDDIIVVYNQQNNDQITVEMAKELSKKRMRYILGSYNARMSGESSKDVWKKTARDFETEHRLSDARMLEWSLSKNGRYPLVRVKQPVSFSPGPYFNDCIEKIPHVFTDTEFNKIKTGIVLRVVSYDPKSRYIQPDFTLDVRKTLKPNELENNKPWIKDSLDYVIWVRPEEIDTHLDLLEPLV